MFDTINTENNFFETSNSLAIAFNEASNDPYNLNANQNNSEQGIYFQGDLRANNFTIDSSYSLNVISGNGNLDFGQGLYDTLDLSNISVEQVIDVSFAEATEGGIVFDPGNGERVFDSISLADGTQILFEGIENLVFSDYTENLSISADDPGFELQWNLHMMGVQNAWRFSQGSDDILIGVQDSGLGIDANGNFHPDINPNRTWFYNGNNTGLTGNLAEDFLIESGIDSEVQLTSHGTSVQGIIAAEANNAEGIAGINWNSDVYNIDILNGNTGDLSLAEATQEMITFANSNGQNLVVNLSIQTLSSFDVLGSVHNDFATIVAENPNVLFVVAAGNFGNEGQEGLSSPAVLAQEYDNVIAVGASWGASDENGLETIPGQRIEYDSWGSQYGDGLTLMGPSEVWTTNAHSNGDFDYEDTFNGTSAAAPNISGVASLVWSANSNLTAAQVKTILSETSYDLGSEGYDIFYGHGFVNADAAVRRAIALGRDNNSFDDSIIDDYINNIIDDYIDSFTQNVDTSPTTFQTFANPDDRPLAFVDRQTNSVLPAKPELPTSLFDYHAVGMENIVELSGKIIKDDLFSSPLYN